MSRTRLLAAAAVLGSSLLIAMGVGLATIDHWLFTALDPGPFDPAATPPAPDFADDDAWAALPEREDAADVDVDAWPAADQRTAPVDVFYVHPTTWVGGAWNGPWDDPAVVEGVERGGTLIQASVFNACCAIYAPRYRQANGRAFIHPDVRSAPAFDVAYGDVLAAFETFIARTDGRGFIVASHSQGTMLAAQLLRQRIAGEVLQSRLVAAYLLGGAVGEEDLGGVPACATETQTGCVVAYNAREPGYVPGGLEFATDDPDTMRKRLCINPLSWGAPEQYVAASEHGGALFLDTPSPSVKPAFADAQCVDGALVVTKMGDLERDLPSRVLLWMMGPHNLHPVEYQLFYGDLRANAGTRVDAWLAAQGEL